ncbi:MAG TPA: ATP-binding protein [Vicinamibacterales bacterium]|nr:ATP-binding protein [Vicinamibacterales bacterium]
MAASTSSAVTRFIWLFTLAAIAVVATLSIVIYRSAVADTVERHSNQQLAMVRTAAVAVQAEIQSISAQLRQFNSLPSVQNIDQPVLPQRIDAAFGVNASRFIRVIVRVDAKGRIFYWTPTGEQLGKGDTIYEGSAPSQWASNRANINQIRVIRGWTNSQPSRRALVIPVWRTAPSAEAPKPLNDFNGVLAVVIDLNDFVQVYLGPSLDELSEDQSIVGLATPDYGVRMGPGGSGVAPAAADAHQHVETQGTSILEDDSGRRLHAWAKFPAANETWLVASSSSYDLVAAQIQRSTLNQLALSVALLIAVPIAGFLVARRERLAQHEQRRLERQLGESQKMEAIGKLAGGVAHDFNNMLTAILGYASMIQEDAPPKSGIQQQATQIRRAAESAATLTQKLLAFSRRQVLQADLVDFSAMLENLGVLIRRVIGENITVTTQAAPDLWPILADPVQVEQSIVNLAINARDAMPNGGTLQITARNAPRPQGERRPDGEVKPGEYVQITVTDTGTGMDEATRARMFEPFFTTKPHGQGTGLGLSTVYGFVRQCGGYIDVLSTPGRGTSIELLLPRARVSRDARPSTPTSLLSDHATPGRETVLVVEDEEAVRQFAVESLQRHGYQVLQSSSGEEALNVASTHDGTIHVLLTDVVMPGMKGPELAARLRALRPGLRVLLMSGYAADIVTPDDLKDAALVSKPFTPASLSRAVRSVLDIPISSARASQ